MKFKQHLMTFMFALTILLTAADVPAQNAPFRQKATDDKTAVSNASENGKHGIHGSWTAVVTPDGSPSFNALLTFDKGGGVIGSAQGDVLLDPPPGVPPGATAVHGAWKRIGNNKYLFTVRQIFYGADGSFQGGNKVRNLVELNPNADTMSGHYVYDITDASGTVVFSGSGTITASRIEAESPAP